MRLINSNDLNSYIACLGPNIAGGSTGLPVLQALIKQRYRTSQYPRSSTGSETASSLLHIIQYLTPILQRWPLSDRLIQAEGD